MKKLCIMLSMLLCATTVPIAQATYFGSSDCSLTGWGCEELAKPFDVDVVSARDFYAGFSYLQPLSILAAAIAIRAVGKYYNKYQSAIAGQLDAERQVQELRQRNFKQALEDYNLGIKGAELRREQEKNSVETAAEQQRLADEAASREKQLQDRYNAELVARVSAVEALEKAKKEKERGQKARQRLEGELKSLADAKKIADAARHEEQKRLADAVSRHEALESALVAERAAIVAREQALSGDQKTLIAKAERLAEEHKEAVQRAEELSEERAELDRRREASARALAESHLGLRAEQTRIDAAKSDLDRDKEDLAQRMKAFAEREQEHPVAVMRDVPLDDGRGLGAPLPAVSVESRMSVVSHGDDTPPRVGCCTRTLGAVRKCLAGAAPDIAKGAYLVIGMGVNHCWALLEGQARCARAQHSGIS